MSKNYKGTPEYYLTVPKDNGIDEDAISCILHRMSAINYLLWANIEGGGKTQEGASDEIIEHAFWAIEGLIKQAQILLSGSEVES